MGCFKFIFSSTLIPGKLKVLTFFNSLFIENKIWKKVTCIFLLVVNSTFFLYIHLKTNDLLRAVHQLWEVRNWPIDQCSFDNAEREYDIVPLSQRIHLNKAGINYQKFELFVAIHGNSLKSMMPNAKCFFCRLLSCATVNYLFGIIISLALQISPVSWESTKYQTSPRHERSYGNTPLFNSSWVLVLSTTSINSLYSAL